MNKIIAITIYILFTGIHLFAQKKTTVYLGAYDVFAYDDRGIFIPNPQKIDYYTNKYQKSMGPVIENAFKEEEDIQFKYISPDSWSASEKNEINDLKDHIFDKYKAARMRSSTFKKIVPKIDQSRIEALNTLADKLNTDVVTFIYINFNVKEKPNKKTGKYDETPRGYIIYLGLIVDANSGKIISDYENYFPKSFASTDKPAFVSLDEKDVQKFTDKFIRKFANDYERTLKKSKN